MSRYLLPIAMEYEIRPGETVTEAIIEAISLSENCHPRDLPPLYESIDTDALNNVFQPIRENTTDSPSDTVVFKYMDYWVTVYNTGLIEVEPITETILIEQ